MTSRFDNQKNEYNRRVNEVLNFINENFAQELSLEALAEIAQFSPYHFHRIFKGVTGETLNTHIQRIRLENAARLLRYDHKKLVTEIALDCGFSSSASFARSFKKLFSMSATEWRDMSPTENSKIGKVCRKIEQQVSSEWEVSENYAIYIDPETGNSIWRIPMIKRSDITVEIRNMEEVTVAYIRNTGPFKGEQKLWIELFNELKTWAATKNHLKCPNTNFYTIFRDTFHITQNENFRSDVAISVENGVVGDGRVSVSTIPAGKYAVAEFDIEAHEIERAWDLMFNEWLPKSGFQPDDRYCFERYLNNPQNHPQKRTFLQIAIPVTSL